jgi:hypothetical protein
MEIPAALIVGFVKCLRHLSDFFFTKTEMPRQLLVKFPSRKFSAGHFSDSRVAVREEVGEEENFNRLSVVWTRQKKKKVHDSNCKNKRDTLILVRRAQFREALCVEGCSNSTDFCEGARDINDNYLNYREISHNSIGKR